MGLILDLAVMVIGLVIIGSLATLAWTLAVPMVRAVHRERDLVRRARHKVAESLSQLESRSDR